MTKNSKLINTITLASVIVVVAVFSFKRFYLIGKGISEAPESLEIITGFTIHAMAALIVLVHIFIHGKFNKKILILLILLDLFLVLSFQNAGWVHGRFAVIGIPLMFFFLIGIFPRYKIVNTPALIIKYYYSFFAVAPVLLYLFVPEYKEILESAGQHNFRGFESSRTTYGFIASLAFTSHLIDRKRGWMIFVGLICIGIYYSQNRAAVVTCAILLIYILIYDDRVRNKNKKNLLLIAGIAIPLFVVVFVTTGTRPLSDILHESGRLALLGHYLGYIMDHFLFGSGGYYASEILVLKGLIRPGMPAHNFILETLSSFGIFVTITWIILLSYFWKKLHKMGRTYILFIITYGSLHNGLGLSVFNAGYFFIFLLAVLTSNFFRSGQVLRGIRPRVIR
jgi:hypothetical protein